jgi:hypothetical protein
MLISTSCLGTGCTSESTGSPTVFPRRGHADPEERKVYLSVTKDEVKAAPDYDPDRFRDAGYRAEVGDQYNRVTR